MLALEDVAAHIHAMSALAHDVIGQSHGLVLRQLLAAGHHDGHRAGRRDLLEILTVVGLDDLYAHLGDDAGSQLEEPVRPGHVLTHGAHA